MKSILDTLSNAEAHEVLHNLCSSDPELRKRIEVEAEKLLREVNPDEVAGDVMFELEGIDIEELWRQSGETSQGYMSPDEMAIEMVEDVIRPFQNRIKEYAKIGMPEESTQFCMGVLKALYQYHYESECEFKNWAVDAPAECFASILENWKKAGAQATNPRCMNEFLAAECPKWADKP